MQGNDGTFNFLETVLKEVLDLFPSQHIHIGGDEVRLLLQQPSEYVAFPTVMGVFGMLQGRLNSETSLHAAKDTSPQD